MVPIIPSLKVNGQVVNFNNGDLLKHLPDATTRANFSLEHNVKQFADFVGQGMLSYLVIENNEKGKFKR